MKLRPFELALVIIFMVLMIVALFMLSKYSPSGGTVDTTSIKQNVTIWGTLPAGVVNETLRLAIENDDSFRLVQYEYHDPANFEWDLTNALADGTGPDLVLYSHEKLVSLRKRITPIPYDTLPLADVRATYIDGAEIFALTDGVYALPLVVDPLLLYWNRDILSTQGFIQPPSTWEQLINRMFPDLIERDFNRTIRRSVVAMGEYTNVHNAFATISLLLIQGGSSLVSEDGKEYYIQLNQQVGGDANPFVNGADFYTRFSQPSNTLYSWNRAQREDRLQFVSEDLVFYFGFASEGHEIERLNPNLNFAAAEVPQGAAATVRRTYGKFYGISVLRTSNNVNEAVRVMYTLAGQGYAARLAAAANMVPVERSLVEQGSNDIFGRTAYLVAPVARGWLNPNRNETDTIFATMVADINENRRGTSAATADAASRLRLEY
ncbi:hypothetical protein KC887_07135 [Candidatus Kaiserbacteria bacterium]|nr:hypothetical protein [Candidatus Kaiserbacteria bacterium]